MMMIAPNSGARKGGKERVDVKGEYGRISGEEEGNADYGWMMMISLNSRARKGEGGGEGGVWKH